MTDRDRLAPGTVERTRAAAMSIGALAASYAALGIWYFYEDFFKYLGQGAPTIVDGSGFGVAVNCHLWTMLSPWRLVFFGAALILLAVSSGRLWAGRPGARALSLVTLWGVLLPQMFWFTEFVVDWHNGYGLYTVVLAAVAVVAIPTMLIFEGSHTLADWRRIERGRGRLLATMIISAWSAFAATEFLDHSYQLDSSLAYHSSLATILFATLAVVGIMRLRVWGIAAALAASVAIFMVPVSFAFTPFIHTHGYIDALVNATTGCSLRATMTAVSPALITVALTGPFLRSFVRKLRA